MFVLSALSVDIGAKFLGVLLTIELISLVVVGFAAIVDGGPEGPDFAASFSPSAVLAGGLTGGAGVAFAFALASFIGFEATAIYGEESRDPKKTVPRATYISVVLITVIFAFVGFGMVTGLGATDIQNKVFEVTAIEGVPLADPSAMPFGLTTAFVGSWLTELFGWIVTTSLFAAPLAFQNSAARYLFSMSGAGVLPQRPDAMGKGVCTHRHHAPTESIPPGHECLAALEEVTRFLPVGGGDDRPRRPLRLGHRRRLPAGLVALHTGSGRSGGSLRARDVRVHLLRRQRRNGHCCSWD